MLFAEERVIVVYEEKEGGREVGRNDERNGRECKGGPWNEE